MKKHGYIDFEDTKQTLLLHGTAMLLNQRKCSIWRVGQSNFPSSPLQVYTNKSKVRISIFLKIGCFYIFYYKFYSPAESFTFSFLIKKSKQKKSSAVKRKAKILEISLKLGKLEALRASQTVPSFLRLIFSDFFTLFFSRRVVSILTV